MSQVLVEGGVPVAPDVNRIREAFPDRSLEAGQIIYHGYVQELLGEPPESARYRTVTNRWRRDVEDSVGKVILAVRGVGFIVADDHAKSESEGKRLKKGYLSAGGVEK